MTPARTRLVGLLSGFIPVQLVYAELLGSAGFALHEVVSLPSCFSILDCRPLHR